MSNFGKILSSKGIENRILSAAGIIAYMSFLAWCFIGVWYYSVKALKLLVLITEIGIPPQIMGHFNAMLTLFALSAYYLFFNKTISNVFWSFPVVKPVLVFGLVFYSGIVLTNNILCLLTHNGFSDPKFLFSIAAGGVTATRVFMSYIFNRYPAEWFASR